METEIRRYFGDNSEWAFVAENNGEVEIEGITYEGQTRYEAAVDWNDADLFAPVEEGR